MSGLFGIPLWQQLVIGIISIAASDVVRYLFRHLRVTWKDKP